MRIIDFTLSNEELINPVASACIKGGCCPGMPQEPIDPDPDDEAND